MLRSLLNSQSRYRTGHWSLAVSVAILGFVLTIASSTGCGSADNIGDVSGTITVEGMAAGPGTIMFDPVPGEGPIGPSAVGHFGADGQYTLTLPGSKKGAFVGDYRVMILAGVKEEFGKEGASSAREPSRINVRYEDIKHSGLKAKVALGKNVLDFNLDP